MSLWSWLFGLNRTDVIKNSIDKEHKELSRLFTLAQNKLLILKSFEGGTSFPEEKTIDKTKRIIDEQQNIISNDCLQKDLNSLPIETELQEHLCSLIVQEQNILQDQIRWFKHNKTKTDVQKNFSQLVMFIHTEISILFGLVHKTLLDLKTQVDTQLTATKELDEFIEFLRQRKIELDKTVFSLVTHTAQKGHIFTNERQKQKEIVAAYRELLEELTTLQKKPLNTEQKNVVNLLSEDATLQLHQIDPIHKDPFIYPYSHNLTHQETLAIIKKLKPSHVVASKELLLKILDARLLLSKLQTDMYRGRYMTAFKQQEDAIFFSVGGPFSHLPLKNPAEASIIIFKQSIYSLNPAFFPRDSGGYPDVKISAPKGEAQQEIEMYIQQRKLSDLPMLFRYLFQHIKHRRLRATEKEAELSWKKPRKNIALFPEGIISTKIGLSTHVEAILIPEKIYYSKEFVPYKTKYPTIRFIPVDDPFSYYWEYVGLKKELFTE